MAAGLLSTGGNGSIGGDWLLIVPSGAGGLMLLLSASAIFLRVDCFDVVFYFGLFVIFIRMIDRVKEYEGKKDTQDNNNMKEIQRCCPEKLNGNGNGEGEHGGVIHHPSTDRNRPAYNLSSSPEVPLGW